MESDSFVFILIIMDLPPGSAAMGSIHEYEWVVPATITDQGRIHVRQDNVESNFLDFSDGNLSIVVSTCYAEYAATDRATSSISCVSRMRLRAGVREPVLAGIILNCIRDHMRPHVGCCAWSGELGNMFRI